MKLWPTTTENKCFVKMLWHLLVECVKTTVLLVCSNGTVASAPTLFFFSFGLPFVLFFLLNIYKNLHIYCYTNTTNFTIFLYNKSGYATTVLWHCASRVLTLCITVAATVFFFFFLSNRFVFFFFFSFKYWCNLTFILLYWYNKFRNIFTIIDESISYKSK